MKARQMQQISAAAASAQSIGSRAESIRNMESE